MSSQRTPAEITLNTENDTAELRLRGDFSLASVTELQGKLQEAVKAGALVVNVSEVGRMDTSGAWALTQAEVAAANLNHDFQIKGASEHIETLIATVRDGLPKPDDEPHRDPNLADRVEKLGKDVVAAGRFLLQLTGFFGLFLERFVHSIFHPRQFRMTSMVHHCQEVGVKAVPIVSLMAFLIGIVLAFQGATQLKRFGAEVYVVDLISVAVLRELGILLTSIIVAGRTASAFTAAIGSMKMREEIDAMRTLGIDPGNALFVPRILALLLMLPILGLIADIAGLFGGGLMSWVELGISPQMFVARLVETTSVNHVLVGLFKAPFFAVIIGVVGCSYGMQVGSNAESLGQKTSSAVVTAIFAVIIADAIFSVFFSLLGV